MLQHIVRDGKGRAIVKVGAMSDTARTGTISVSNHSRLDVRS